MIQGTLIEGEASVTVDLLIKVACFVKKYFEIAKEANLDRLAQRCQLYRARVFATGLSSIVYCFKARPGAYPSL